jgi:hypothetical protein
MGNTERDANRLLAGLEGGTLSIGDAVVLAESLDPALLYAVLTFLRATHPATDPVASAVLARVVRLLESSPVVVRHHKEGERDPISRWFLAEHSWDVFRGRGTDLVALIADKIDS